MDKSDNVPGYWGNRSITVKFSVGIGLLVFLMMIIAATGYLSLAYVQNAHEAIGTSTTIQRLVFEMDREMEKARQLHSEFFRQYPKIGLKKAHEFYAQPAIGKTARAVTISRTLKRIISRTRVSDALGKSNVDLTLYLSSAKRFADTSIESFELVTRLASPSTGREAALEEVRLWLKKKLLGHGELFFTFHDMEYLIDSYRITRERHVMQSAFNVAFRLGKTVHGSQALGLTDKERIVFHLNLLKKIAEEILDIDGAIAAKFRDFALQRQSADAVSDDLIRLAKKEVEISDQKIRTTHRLAVIFLALVTLAGFLGALSIAMILNRNITRRIVRLTNVAQKLKQGSLDVVAEEGVQDELGRLGRTFNFMAARMRALIENLEREVRDRTRKLRRTNESLKLEIRDRKQVEEQLHQSRKMEAIGTLAGGIAHDFNNILSAIMGYAELAQLDLPETSKSNTYIDQVLNASNRAKELVGHILSFSRKNAGDRVPVQINSIVKEIMELLRATIPATIDIQEHIDSGGIILANPTQVHQVIMNLSTNAAQAMEDTGGVLSVGITTETVLKDQLAEFGAPSANTLLKSGEYMKLTVKDTGPGIEPGIMDKIFDPYFTTKETGKGSGVGLAVVHGIATASGGAVRVESRLGRGTSFHVYFPRVHHGKELAGQVVPGGTTAPGGGEHILIVDDEKSLVEINKERLKKLGYRVSATTQSLEALEMFSSRPGDFDLVITDQTMPVITGDQLARRMLAVKPGIPIVLCTGYSASISKAKAKQLGIRAFIMKPVQGQVLAATVRRVLDE